MKRQTASFSLHPPVIAGVPTGGERKGFFALKIMTYSEKLRDPRWQKLRLEIMGRDDFKCRLCRKADKTLNVHHSYYTKGANPWDYPNEFLITVCEGCHKLVELRRQMILKATASPHAQLAILKICHAINRDPFPYPKASPGIIEAIVDFLDACDRSDDESDVSLVSTPIDQSAMRVIEFVMAAKDERVKDARERWNQELSLDELIAMAPDGKESEI